MTNDARARAASGPVRELESLTTVPANSSDKKTTMKTIQVYDKPMCCSTGVCGPQVDPVLPRFAADLAWLKSQGHQVERFNLAQQPAAFVQNSEVQKLLATQGTDCLPLIAVDDRIVSRCEYPSRDLLAAWVSSEAAVATLPVVREGGECCSSSESCG